MDLPVDSRHMNSSNSSESFRKAPDASVLTILNQHFPKTGLPRLLVRQKKVKYFLLSNFLALIISP
jgi:hypothetical protein